MTDPSVTFPRPQHRVATPRPSIETERHPAVHFGAIAVLLALSALYGALVGAWLTGGLS